MTRSGHSGVPQRETDRKDRRMGMSSVAWAWPAVSPFARSGASRPVTLLGTHTQQLRAPSKTWACGGRTLISIWRRPLVDSQPPVPPPSQSDWPHGNLLFSTLRQCPTGDGVLSPRVIVLLCFLVPSSNLRVGGPPPFP